MKMIIGGACQGKLDYARQVMENTVWLDGESCELQALFHAPVCGRQPSVSEISKNCAAGITNFHLYVRRYMQTEENAGNLAEKIIACNPNLIIVGNEIGCGVVPMDAFERNYRETYGRICTKLAAYSAEVHRVVCGIGTVIKHD